MLETALTQLTLFSIGAGSFGAALITAVLMLSLLRHQRLWSLNYALYPAKSAKFYPAYSPLAQVVENYAVLQTSLSPTKAQSDALTEQGRLPLREGTPDQVVIHITPDESTSAAKAS